MNLGPQEAAREEASLAAIEEGSGEDGEGAPGEGPATSPIRVPCEEDICSRLRNHSDNYYSVDFSFKVKLLRI